MASWGRESEVILVPRGRLTSVVGSRTRSSLDSPGSASVAGRGLLGINMFTGYNQLSVYALRHHRAPGLIPRRPMFLTKPPRAYRISSTDLIRGMCLSQVRHLTPPSLNAAITQQSRELSHPRVPSPIPRTRSLREYCLAVRTPREIPQFSIITNRH